MSRSVVSWKITYGGTPRSRASRRRTSRSASNRSLIAAAGDALAQPTVPALREDAGFDLAIQDAGAPSPRSSAAPARGQPQHRIRIALARQQAVADQLLDVAANRGRRFLLQQPERRQLVVPARDDLLGRACRSARR